ncbi:uncharacterized protein LOC129580248 [Sitodiplosis mosellana]|uniref:uncharacterized protein LOC129580248 n=1 Tax=Sitodiplosis mosellana TaxID=263140 RepID=UPI0024452A7F|nr:uncharacterized protein LOC129580248 [Sitodiplosis mosellana]
MAKRYFLTSGNSKWITIGIQPQSKLLSSEASGFYVDILIDGNKGSMCLNGITGFKKVCRALRQFEEFRFSYPSTMSSYDALTDEIEFCVSKKLIGASICYNIVNTITGDMSFLAVTSVMELLKIEKLIIAAANNMDNMVADIESKFTELTRKFSSDFSTNMNTIESSGDLFAVEILTNFNELFKICVEEMARTQQLAAATAPSAPTTRKRAAAAPKPKANKKAAIQPPVQLPVVVNQGEQTVQAEQNVQAEQTVQTEQNVQAEQTIEAKKTVSAEQSGKQKTYKQSDIDGLTASGQIIDLSELIDYDPVSENDGEAEEEEEEETATQM